MCHFHQGVKYISLFLSECACTTIIVISPRIFSLIYGCCVSIIIVICICPHGALIWLYHWRMCHFHQGVKWHSSRGNSDCTAADGLWNRKKTGSLAQGLALLHAISVMRAHIFITCLCVSPLSFHIEILLYQHGRSALDTSRTLFLLASTQCVSCQIGDESPDICIVEPHRWCNVCVVTSSAVDHGFNFQAGQWKKKKNGFWNYSTKQQ
jgi:hypothetical protein